MNLISHADYNNSLQVTLPARGFITFHFVFHTDNLFNTKISKKQKTNQKKSPMTTEPLSSLSCIPSSNSSALAITFVSNLTDNEYSIISYLYSLHHFLLST